MRSQYFVDTSKKDGEFHDQLSDYHFLKNTLFHGVSHCNMKIMVFCYVSTFNLVDKYHLFGSTCCLHLQNPSLDLVHWKWLQKIAAKRLYIFTQLDGVSSQKTVIIVFLSVKISNPTVLFSPQNIAWPQFLLYSVQGSTQFVHSTRTYSC
jgi:hypothetical protein